MSLLGDLVSSLPFEEDHYTFHLDVAKDSFRIHDFYASEALSTPFEYVLRMTTTPGPSLRDLLGHDATFTVKHGGKRVRTVHGFLSSVRPLGSDGTRRERFAIVRLVPSLLHLQHSGGRWLHREETIQETIEKLAQPLGIKCEWRLDGQHDKRAIRHQLDESDLEFATRILAREGIHYFFLHGEEECTLVLSDFEGGYKDMEGGTTLRYRETGGAVTDEHVRNLSFEEVVRPEAVAARAYYPRKPRLPMDAKSDPAEVTGKKAPVRHERYAWDVSAYEDPGETGGGRFAREALERLRHDATKVDGTSTCYRLQVGSVFELDGHEDGHLNRKYIVTSLDIEAVDPKSSHGGTAAAETPNEPPLRFHGVFSDVPLRPVYRAPNTPVTLARIVGPKESEAEVDAYGRVRVQFLWDRRTPSEEGGGGGGGDAAWDERATCFIRVHMPYAGDQHGVYYPPRAGMECVVSFVDGDPDEPYVSEFLYNGENLPPHPLPAASRKYTIMTRSSPKPAAGEAGWNELTFDTTSGAEQVFLKAQKDLVETVGNNHTESTAVNHSTSVGAAQTVSVGAARSVNVGGIETIAIKKARNETVGETETVTIGKGRTHTVTEGADALNVNAGDRTVTVKGNQTNTITHLDKLDAEDVAVSAKKTYVLTANDKVDMKQKAMSLVFEGEAMTVSSPKSLSMTAPDGSIVVKDGKVTVEATSELTLKCGPASITLKKDGTISISGSASVEVACQGSTLKLEPAKAGLNGPDATLQATGVATVNGALVKIG